MFLCLICSVCTLIMIFISCQNNQNILVLQVKLCQEIDSLFLILKESCWCATLDTFGNKIFLTIYRLQHEFRGIIGFRRCIQCFSAAVLRDVILIHTLASVYHSSTNIMLSTDEIHSAESCGCAVEGQGSTISWSKDPFRQCLYSELPLISAPVRIRGSSKVCKPFAEPRQIAHVCRQICNTGRDRRRLAAGPKFCRKKKFY